MTERAMSPLAMWVFYAASVVALVVGVVTGLRQQSYARCAADVFDAVIAVQVQRSQAEDQDRAADRAESAVTAALIRAVFAATTREQTLAAYAAYDRELAEIDAGRAATQAERAASPLPAAPSETCN